MKQITYYIVEQGMHNPRNPSDVGWRPWGEYGTRSEAETEYKQLPIARIVEARIVSEKK